MRHCNINALREIFVAVLPFISLALRTLYSEGWPGEWLARRASARLCGASAAEESAAEGSGRRRRRRRRRRLPYPPISARPRLAAEESRGRLRTLPHILRARDRPAHSSQGREDEGG
ncbi:hypothetical protein KM043_010506 [Ampulex compressa]|nr:hypothetical protein KM043_010506 [Ampulex compressa]